MRYGPGEPGLVDAYAKLDAAVAEALRYSDVDLRGAPPYPAHDGRTHDKLARCIHGSVNACRY